MRPRPGPPTPDSPGPRPRGAGTLRRVVQVLLGTITMGSGIAVLLHAHLGLLPLDVLHTAVAIRGGWTIGGGIIAVQAVLLLCYLPLRLRPGIGTVAAAVIPAITCDMLLRVLPTTDAVVPRVGMLAAGIVLFAAGTATYLGAGLGSLPRDGLMLALHHRRGYRLSTIRVVADLGCLLAGAALLGPVPAVRSGIVGIGSVLLALLLGPAIARLLPIFRRAPGNPVSRSTGAWDSVAGPADTETDDSGEDTGAPSATGIRRTSREDERLL